MLIALWETVITTRIYKIMIPARVKLIWRVAGIE